MNVETQEGKEPCLPFLRGKRECNHRYHHSECHIMKRVVKLRKPQQGVGRVSCQQLGNNAEAVDIWCDAGERNNRTISALQLEAVCEDPAREKVSDRAHD